MTKCSQKTCDVDATVQFDHCGELQYGCEEHWTAYCQIMKAMGTPAPHGYPIGTEPVKVFTPLVTIDGESVNILTKPVGITITKKEAEQILFELKECLY